MATTLDPFNFIIESTRAHLRTNLTDPLGTSRDSTNTPFVTAGKSLLGVQYPYIHITLAGTGPSEDAALGQNIGSGSAKMFTADVKIEVITGEDINAGSLSNEKLVNNLSSSVLIQMVQLTGLIALDSSFDFKNVELDSSDEILLADKEYKKVHFYTVDFLWRY